MTGLPASVMRATVLAIVMASITSVPGGPVAPARAAEYTLETSARYDVRPEDRQIAVTVDVTFTNTTPDPPDQFSVFDELKLAVHDQAIAIAASDADGDLTVSAAVEDEVNVATIALRGQVRFEDTAEIQLRYTLPDSDDPRLRVRPSLVIFPAWSFGSSGEVRVTLPESYEVNVDGDTLRDQPTGFVSGPIADPTTWLALVTAVAEAGYASFSAAVPLGGGTADLRVRSFSDDEAWGERTLALLEGALPVLEKEIGLPYPGVGELVVTQATGLNMTGIGEDRSAAGPEILVAFDQPPFTVLHQVAHVWLSEDLVESRWIREGLASEVAERVAQGVELQAPYDPSEVAEREAESAFPLDAWSADAGAGGEAYGYAVSWSVAAEIRERVGEEALRTVLMRVSASVGPYQPADITSEPTAENGAKPTVPLTTRSFLDQLETVGGEDMTDIFRARVLFETDVALLDARAEARAAFEGLVAASDGWGAPDPVAGAMTAWSFEDAMVQIGSARDWLSQREDLLVQLGRAGLSAPDRLQQAFRAHGGGADAQNELTGQRELAQSYIETAEGVNAERSFVERVGLLAGADPAQQLRLANGRFADGDLTGSLDALRETQQLLASAEPAGIARLASAVLIVIVLLAIAVLLFRRRGSYTARR